MKRQEKLQEAYEDALFTLLMNHVAELHGKQALQENRALREDPDAEVPQDIRRACLKAINRTFRKKNARTAGRTTVRILKTVALVALLGALALSAAFAAFPEFRAGTLNMIKDNLNGGVSFGFTSSANDIPTPLEDVKPSLVPDGFELVEDGSYSGNMWARYCNTQGDRLQITLSDNAHFDSEGAEIEWIQIHGLPACLIDQSNITGSDRGKVKVVITNEEEGYILSVRFLPYSPDATPVINKDELIAIAESIFE